MKSKAQRSYLWAKHPEIAKRFEKETPKGKSLPKHVKVKQEMLNTKHIPIHHKKPVIVRTHMRYNARKK